MYDRAVASSGTLLWAKGLLAKYIHKEMHSGYEKKFLSLLFGPLKVHLYDKHFSDGRDVEQVLFM